MKDSSVQVISYWDKGDKQQYTLSVETIRLENGDTSSRELVVYDIDVTVLDQTDTSYTVEWVYKNVNAAKAGVFAKGLGEISRNLKFVFVTNELGVFKELVNWQEIRSYMQRSLASLINGKELTPEMQQAMKQVLASFSTREAIESAGIKEIQQYLIFHGAAYKLNEQMSGQLQLPNLYGGAPFDADFSVSLDEINEADNNFIIRSKQSVNKEQLIEATYNYLTKLKATLKEEGIRKDDLKDLTNEVLVSSRIHGTGWVIYSVQTTTVKMDAITKIEERILEIK